MTRQQRIGTESSRWTLMVHGGAPGRIVRFSQEERLRRREALIEALQVGKDILIAGGSSLDAIQAAVRVMEDAPDYNAGRGAVLTPEGRAELDAAIIDGCNRRAGAVAGLRRVKNPIDLARAVMERSAHVFLIGAGAEQFAAEQDIAFVDPEYFVTGRQLSELRKTNAQELSVSGQPTEMSGTVGAVALDRHGHLAAATSTGGIPNKRHGRVGDSPVIGACIYAENGVCAVSTTGWGEYFIRNAVAHDLYARIKYARESLQSAAAFEIEQVRQMGGYGGLIAVDGKGRMAMPYCTAQMAHGYVSEGNESVIVLEDQ